MFIYTKPCLYYIHSRDFPCRPDAASCHGGEAWMVKNSGWPLVVEGSFQLTASKELEPSVLQIEIN